MKTFHIVGLSAQAIAILNKIKLLTGDSEYVFASDVTNKPVSNNTMLNACKRLGYHKRMTGHGFRGIAATELRENRKFKIIVKNEQGKIVLIPKYPDDYIEIQLGHLTGNETRRAYDSAKYLPERAAMMQDWADYLDTLKNDADVMPIKVA